jgi:hypothetical protein
MKLRKTLISIKGSSYWERLVALFENVTVARMPPNVVVEWLTPPLRIPEDPSLNLSLESGYPD